MADLILRIFFHFFEVTEHHLLLLCLEKVARKASNRPVTEWTDSVFIGLSRELEAETGMRISRSTLKRLFGKMKTQGDYKPQKETRHALAIFAGYRNWEDFAEKEAENLREKLISRAEPQPPRPFVPTGKPGPPSRSLRWVAAIGLLALLLSVVTFWTSRKASVTMVRRPGREKASPEPAGNRGLESRPNPPADTAGMNNRRPLNP